MRILRLAFLLLLLATKAEAATFPYDENANAVQAVKAAMASAENGHKKVLMIFGANWCPACRRLDRSMHEGTTPVDEGQYVIVKIDVGHFDRNLQLARAYGNPIRKGIPASVVATPDNRILYSGSLENFLMPYRRLMKIAAAAGLLFAAMLIAWASVLVARRKTAVLRHS